jgi:hypothetical protein
VSVRGANPSSDTPRTCRPAGSSKCRRLVGFPSTVNAAPCGKAVALTDAVVACGGAGGGTAGGTTAGATVSGCVATGGAAGRGGALSRVPAAIVVAVAGADAPLGNVSSTAAKAISPTAAPPASKRDRPGNRASMGGGGGGGSISAGSGKAPLGLGWLVMNTEYGHYWTMPEPILTPVPPTPGSPVTLGARSPAWLGARGDGVVQVALPGIAERHTALVEREDGWWASEGQGPASINGAPLAGSVHLADGDVLEIAPGYRFQFSTGVAPSPAASAGAASAPRKRRKRRRVRGDREQPPYAVVAVVLLILLVVGGAAYGIWRAVDQSRHRADILTDHQLGEFDSLMVVADDHVERGSALLELGLEPRALDEFALAVNTFTASDLRNHPDVAPRVGALEAAISGIYREHHLKAPSQYAGKSTTLSADQQRAATLTVEQFAVAFAEVAAAYQRRFGEPIEVTGRDHAEHLSLYGPGGALDLRARTMSPAQTAFVTAECHARKIRVKDFSQDAVLQAEIRSAIQSGKFDQAGTGLHLHIDRFGGRRDRWTTANRRAISEPVTTAGI